MILCVNGRLVPASKATVSALDNGFLYGDGFYDTMRTYGGVLLELEEHLTRVERSAKRMKIDMPWSRERLREWTLRVIARNKLKDARVRITVTRGQHGFDFSSSKRPTLVISAEHLKIPPRIYTSGVSAATMRMERLMPAIKTIGLTNMIEAYQTAADLGVYEMICHDADRHVLEGASTNVFIVSRGTLLTPKRGMLPGITRKRVLALAKKLKLRVRTAHVGVATLRGAREVFLTNRPREIIPVVKVDGRQIGSGKPGPVTCRLMAAYDDYIEGYIAKNRKNQLLKS